MTAYAQIFAVDADVVADALAENGLAAAEIAYGKRTRQPRNYLNEREIAELRRRLSAMPAEDDVGNAEQAKPSMAESMVRWRRFLNAQTVSFSTGRLVFAYFCRQ